MKRPRGLAHTLQNDAVEKSGPLNTPCYLWKWSVNHKGYGHMQVNRVRYRAPRWYYEHLVGPIQKGMEIDHLCRNEACIAPLHLEPVSSQVNNQRRRNTKLSPSKIAEIKKMSDSGYRQTDIAATMGVTQANISAVLLAKTWKNIAR